MIIGNKSGFMNPRDESGDDQSTVVSSQGEADVKIRSNKG